MEVLRRTCSPKVLRNSFHRRFSKKGSTKEPKAEKISKPKRLECFVAVAEYTAQAPGELTLQSGTKVEVLEKNDIGWWFVNSEDEQGWVPSTYLEADGGEKAATIPRAAPGEEEVFVCIEDFQASSKDEISLQKGVAVAVVQKNLDGWWLIKYQGQEAFAPGTYLKKASNATRLSIAEKSQLSGVEIVSSLQDVSTIMNSDKKSQSNIKPESSNTSKPERPSLPSTVIKQRSLERGGSLKPPPRQNSIKRTEAPLVVQKSPIYVTIDDFTDTVGDGLSFKQGQTVQVLEKNSSGWWLVRLDRAEGWVPASYLKSSSANRDMPSLYEFASTQEFDGEDEDSDDGDWYTEPDEFPVEDPRKRPLPEIPTEYVDYESVAEVQKPEASPMPPPLPAKKDIVHPALAKKDSDPLAGLKGKSSHQPLLPKTDRSDNTLSKSADSGGQSDLAAVLKAKFESRSGGAETERKAEKEDNSTNQSNSSVPSLKKPSEIKKLKSTWLDNQNKKEQEPDKSLDKPPPPPKSKSPIAFEKKPQIPQPPVKPSLPKFPPKPSLSAKNSSGNKSETPISNTNSVKSLAATLNESTPLKPPSFQTTTPKAAIPSKPTVATKPKPSIPSKPSVAAKPSVMAKPKVNQNVSSLASSLNSKLSFNKPVESNETTSNNNDNHHVEKPNTSSKSLPVSKSEVSAGGKADKTFVALYDFDGQLEGELSMREGDTVEILEDNGDWAFVQLWDEQGWVPASYLNEV